MKTTKKNNKKKMKTTKKKNNKKKKRLRTLITKNQTKTGGNKIKAKDMEAFRNLFSLDAFPPYRNW